MSTFHVIGIHTLAIAFDFGGDVDAFTKMHIYSRDLIQSTSTGYEFIPDLSKYTEYVTIAAHDRTNSSTHMSTILW